MVIHEQEFCDAKGVDHMEVVANILQEIITLCQENLDEPTTNGLGKVTDTNCETS